MSGKIELIHHHELISFALELQHIRFRFGSLTVEMHSEIEIITANGPRALIKDVWNREGDLNALWPLIGKQLEKLIADDDSFRLIFDDGTIIRRKYELANELVNFWGPEPDAFTSYPNHLTQPAGLHSSKDEIWTSCVSACRHPTGQRKIKAKEFPLSTHRRISLTPPQSPE